MDAWSSLEKSGKNFAAGMSGGIAYVLDEDSDLYTEVNKAMVTLEEVTNKYDVQELKDMIQEHVAYTNSEKGKQILDNFEQYLPKFKKDHSDTIIRSMLMADCSDGRKRICLPNRHRLKHFMRIQERLRRWTQNGKTNRIYGI